MAHLQALSVDIPLRAAGTPGESAAAEYIRDQLASFGYEVSIQEFQIAPYQGTRATITVDGRADVIPRPQAFPGAAYADVSGKLVAAGIGQPGDFPPGTAGAIVLIERGTLTFSEKIANAQAAGAVGVIVYNNEDGSFEGALGENSGLPAVMLPRSDGLALVSLAGSSANLNVELIESGSVSRNVVAKAPGGDCRVIAGGHLDSVPAGPGANDNGSGTATVIELARLLAARSETGHVCFALFGAEELGLLGSAYYVSQLTLDEQAAVIGMLNFDMFGVGSDWAFLGTADMTTLMSEVAFGLGIPVRVEVGPVDYGSDHASFTAAGISAILFNCFCDPNYHTTADRYEFIDPAKLQEAGEIGLGMTERMLEQAGG